jgi:hypothetical protein
VSGPVTFDDAGRAALLAEWDRQAAEPAPRGITAGGCALLLIAAALAILLPRVVRALGAEPPRWLLLATMLILGLVITDGLSLVLRGGSAALSAATTRAAEALETLTSGFDTLDAEARRRTAVSLLCHAWHGTGASAVCTLDIAVARVRLRAALPYVVAAERVLRDASRMQPVFTMSEGEPHGS